MTLHLEKFVHFSAIAASGYRSLDEASHNGMTLHLEKCRSGDQSRKRRKRQP
jgi:cold shock CspA family protein